MDKLVIWGASGHALVVADTIRSQAEYEIVGFLDDVHPERRGTEFCGALILGGREQLDILHGEGINNLIFGIGDCQARLKLAGLVREKGFELISAIHPSAVVARDAFLGNGTLVAAKAVVNSAARIGENVIINTAAIIEHECVIEDGAHICPGVNMAGKVHIGRGAWVGIGATVMDQINIGTGAKIGAGAVVVRDVPDFMLAYGVPAKVMKEIEVDS